MPVWIGRLSLIPLPLTVYALLLLAGAWMAVLKVLLVRRRYGRDGAGDRAVQRFRAISRPVEDASLLAVCYTEFVLILPSIGLISRLTAAVAILVLPFIVLGTILTVDHFVSYNLIKGIRGTVETRPEGLARKLRQFTFTAIPYAVFWVPIIAFYHPARLVPRNMPIGVLIFDLILGVLMGTLYLLLISWIGSWFLPLALGARRVNADRVYGKLFATARKAGLDRLKIYVWPGIRNKYANAMFSGLTDKNIFISDYLLEQFSDDEIEWVMGHEIGHGRRGHARSHILLTMLFVASVTVAEVLTLILLPGLSLAVRSPIIGAVALLYLLAVGSGVRRVQERQADAYALELGARPLAGIAALYKLAKLNHSPVYLHKVAEKLQTHPSITNRIRWIMTEKNIPEEELAAIESGFGEYTPDHAERTKNGKPFEYPANS